MPAPPEHVEGPRAGGWLTWTPPLLFALLAVLGVLVRGDHGFARAEAELLRDIAGSRPDWLVDAARIITELGTYAIGFPIALVVGLAALWRAQRRPRTVVREAAPPGEAPAVEARADTSAHGDAGPQPSTLRWRAAAPAFTPLIALAVTGPLNALAKAIVGRPRPEEALRAITEVGSGYPSGHSAHAAALWIALALVLPANHRRLWLTLGAGIAVAVGLTRVILVVHSPTDVLGGWALGLACALLAWRLTSWLAAARIDPHPSTRRNER